MTVSGVTLDSRAVRPGDLYAALPGSRTHGAQFAGQAAGLGASAVLTDPDGPGPGCLHRLPVLVVADPRASPRRGRGRGLRPTRPTSCCCSGSPAPTARPRPPTCSRPGCARPATSPGWSAPSRRGSPARCSRATAPRRRRPTLQALLAVMVERGVHGGGDGGVQPRAGAGPGGRRPLRRRGVHQPQPGPPGLPPDARGVLPRQGLAVHPGAARARAWSTSTTRTAGGWPARRRCRSPPSRASGAPADWQRPRRPTARRRLARSRSPGRPASAHRRRRGCPAASTSPTPSAPSSR